MIVRLTLLVVEHVVTCSRLSPLLLLLLLCQVATYLALFCCLANAGLHLMLSLKKTMWLTATFGLRSVRDPHTHHLLYAQGLILPCCCCNNSHANNYSAELMPTVAPTC